MPTPLLISKSHMESFWDCPRKGYWQYVHEGGVQKVGESFDFGYGKIMHEALANIAGPDLGPVDWAAFCQDQYRVTRTAVYQLCIDLGRDHDNAANWAAIAEGSLRGFVTSLWPKLMAEYEVAHVEVPCILLLGEDIYYVAIPDLILRHKTSGECWYVEYKTTSARFDARWIGSWDSAVQVHAGIRAAEATLGITISGCLVVGVSKGYRNSYDGTQQSPFAFGWVRRGSPGVVPDQYQIERPKSYKGWEKFGTWTLTEGLGSWVERMKREVPQVLEAQFAVTPPILVRDDIVGGFLNQVRQHGQALRDYQQGLVDYAKQDDRPSPQSLLDLYYPQTFRACSPAFGYGCSYKDACWTDWIGEDPVGSGLFAARDVKHQEPFIKLLEVRA